MPLPKTPEARLYFRAAKQRFDDAQWLLAGDRTTGAVYLAGYTVECFMKALVLASVSSGLRAELLAEFRGSRAHNIEWLGYLYRRHVGISIPRAVVPHLTRVAAWSTDLRYATAALDKREARRFFESVILVSEWPEGRM